jgi:hypothetical protein
MGLQSWGGFWVKSRSGLVGRTTVTPWAPQTSLEASLLNLPPTPTCWIVGESRALDASKASDDGVQGRALGRHLLLEGVAVESLGPSLAPLPRLLSRPLCSRRSPSCACVCLVLRQWVFLLHLTSPVSLLADALPLALS